MQEQPARLAARMRCENFAAQPSHIFKPRAEVFRQLLVDLAAQLLRDRGTLAGGRNGDLQRAPADHGTKIKVAVGRIVHTVGQNLARDGFPINLCVDFGGIGGGDDQINAIEVGDFKGPLDPFETAIDCELANFRSRHWSNHAQPQASLEQAVDLVERNRARADNEAGATFEFEKDRQQAHGLFLVERAD
jgi:hypothetical protein